MKQLLLADNHKIKLRQLIIKYIYCKNVKYKKREIDYIYYRCSSKLDI